MSADSVNPGDIVVEYVPPPPPSAGKYVVTAPRNRFGNSAFPTLFLTEEMALGLYNKLHVALFGEDGDAEADA